MSHSWRRHPLPDLTFEPESACAIAKPMWGHVIGDDRTAFGHHDMSQRPSNTLGKSYRLIHPISDHPIRAHIYYSTLTLCSRERLSTHRTMHVPQQQRLTVNKQNKQTERGRKQRLTVNKCGPVTSTPPSTSAALTYPWYLDAKGPLRMLDT
jgi:hypothetical protein